MSTTTCPVLTPSKEEFKDFRKYLNTIDNHFEAGIVKVVPPKEYRFTRSDYNDLNIILPHFYEQHIRKAEEDTPKDAYIVDIKMQKGLSYGAGSGGGSGGGSRGYGISIQDFKKILNTKSDIPNARGVPPHEQYEAWSKREEKFWSSIASLANGKGNGSSSTSRGANGGNICGKIDQAEFIEGRL